jgi:hypothetical protein
MPLTAFIDGIRSIVAGLREGPPTHPRVNGAAVSIDHLGRRLHGLGCVRDREIADCFTAAVGELGACHPLPEEARVAAVAAAIHHLDAAATHAEEGVVPSPPRS